MHVNKNICVVIPGNPPTSLSLKGLHQLSTQVKRVKLFTATLNFQLHQFPSTGVILPLVTPSSFHFPKLSSSSFLYKKLWWNWIELPAREVQGITSKKAFTSNFSWSKAKKEERKSSERKEKLFVSPPEVFEDFQFSFSFFFYLRI